MESKKCTDINIIDCPAYNDDMPLPSPSDDCATCIPFKECVRCHQPKNIGEYKYGYASTVCMECEAKWESKDCGIYIDCNDHAIHPKLGSVWYHA